MFSLVQPVHRGYLDSRRRPIWIPIKNRNASVSGGPVAELWRHKLFLFYFVGFFPWTLQNREMADMDSPLDFELEDSFQRSPISRKKRFFPPLIFFFCVQVNCKPNSLVLLLPSPPLPFCANCSLVFALVLSHHWSRFGYLEVLQPLEFSFRLHKTNLRWIC